MHHNLALRPLPREDVSPTSRNTTLSLDSGDTTDDRLSHTDDSATLNRTDTTRQPNEQNSRKQQVDRHGNNRKSSSETTSAAAAATTTTPAPQVTTTTAATTTTPSTPPQTPLSPSGTTITLPPIPKPLNVLCLVLSIAGYLLETTMNVSVAIFGIGVGVGLIIGDTATAVTNSSSSSSGNDHGNIQHTNITMTAYPPHQQRAGIDNNGQDVSPYHHYASSRTNLLPAQ